MFEKVWNNATLQCRGLILDDYGNTVALPWKKFFNYGERAVEIGSHDPVEIVDKMDGSLGIGYPTPDGWAVATRGSFTSDQAIWATNYLRKMPKWTWIPNEGYTPLWEIIYPENRIIVDYGNAKALVLLGAVDNEWGLYYGPKEAAGLLCWEGETATVMVNTTIASYMSSPNCHRDNAEGVVVRSGTRMVKIKQQDYVAAHAVDEHVEPYRLEDAERGCIGA